MVEYVTAERKGVVAELVAHEIAFDVAIAAGTVTGVIPLALMTGSDLARLLENRGGCP